MAKKSFAVIGLGQFGISIVQELVETGADVIAIDNSPAKVKEISDILPTSFIADSTDEKALKELGIKDVDSAIIAYGHNIEASVITTVVLRELGVKHILVRADDDYYVPILKKLGATEVIAPQKAAGAALANRLGNDDYVDYYKLNDKFSVVSLIINSGFIPRTLKELNSKTLFGVNIVLVSRKDKSFVPGGNDSILPDDTIYIVGSTKDVRKFRESINGGKSKKQRD